MVLAGVLAVGFSVGSVDSISLVSTLAAILLSLTDGKLDEILRFL